MEPYTFIKETLSQYISKRKVLILLLGLGLSYFLPQMQLFFLNIYPQNEYINIAQKTILCLLIALAWLISHYYENKLYLKPFLNVLWDKEDNIYCSHCKVMLAPININKEQWSHFINKSSFQCPKCQQIYLLKDREDELIRKQKANSLIKEQKTANKSVNRPSAG